MRRRPCSGTRTIVLLKCQQTYVTLDVPVLIVLNLQLASRRGALAHLMKRYNT